MDFVKDALDRVRDQLPDLVHLNKLVLSELDLLVPDFLANLAIFNLGS